MSHAVAASVNERLWRMDTYCPILAPFAPDSPRSGNACAKPSQSAPRMLPLQALHSLINGPFSPSTGSAAGSGTAAMRFLAAAISLGSARTMSHSRPSG